MRELGKWNRTMRFQIKEFTTEGAEGTETSKKNQTGPLPAPEKN